MCGLRNSLQVKLMHFKCLEIIQPNDLHFCKIFDDNFGYITSITYTLWESVLCKKRKMCVTCDFANISCVKKCPTICLVMRAVD